MTPVVPRNRHNNEVRPCLAAEHASRINAQAEIRQLSFPGNVALLETVWAEIATDPDEVEVPQWHKDILDERDLAAKEGRASHSMRQQVLDLARDDLIEGFYFYEKQEVGLGGYFLTSLYADIEALKIFFGIHPKACRNFHRALSDRFPFAIYYPHDTQNILVRPAFGCRRKPSWIRRHIKNA